MKLSWNVAAIAGISSMAACNAAFVPVNCHTGPLSSLSMVRRRSFLPSTRSLLAPSRIFQEMDEIFEEQFAELDSFFESPLLLRPSSSLLDRANRLSDLAIVRRPRPRATYKINEDKEKVELIVNIPGIKANDIEAKVEQDGRVIRLSGVSKINEDGAEMESRFERAFILGRGRERFDADKVTANFAEGILTITAPKITETEDDVRNIVITEEKAALPAEKAAEDAEVKNDSLMKEQPTPSKEAQEVKEGGDDVAGEDMTY